MSSSYEEEIDLNMGHMLTSLSGHLASCQSHSDLRTSSMLYAYAILSRKDVSTAAPKTNQVFRINTP